MDELRGLLPLLKVGSSKNPIPIYSSYVHSDGIYMSTCNDDVYIKLECESGFTGDTNIYVLDSILDKLPEDQKVLVEQKNNESVTIESGRFKSDLIVMDTRFPEKTCPNVPMMEVTPEFLEQVKLALKFTGKLISTYVYVGDGFVLAYDGNKVYHATGAHQVETPFLLTKQIIQTLAAGDYIGCHEHNVVVRYPMGFGVFSCDRLDNYPIDKLTSFVNESSETLDPVTHMETFRNELDKIQPIFHGERQHVATFENKNNSIRVSADVVSNGSAFVDVVSMCDLDFNIMFDISFFKNVPDDFNILIKPGNPSDRFVAQRNNEVIIMMGVG